ncbi:MAG: hypothetical protein RL757_1806 [Bacteroidota bacterium]|jgi:hypothetical protein
MKIFKIKNNFFKANLLLAIGSLLTLTSCDPESFFSPIVDVKLEPHVPKIALLADWETGSDSLSVFVGRSRGSQDSSDYNTKNIFTGTFFGGFDSVPNAKVELLRNDVLLGEIPRVSTGRFFVKGRFKLDSVSGATYKIRVSAPNLPTVEAVQVIQARPILQRFKYVKDGAIRPSDNSIFDPSVSVEKVDEYSFEIGDPASEQNFYSIISRYGTSGSIYPSLEYRDSITQRIQTRDLFLETLDPLSQYDRLADATFNGTNYVWRLYDRSTTEAKPKRGNRIFLNLATSPKDIFLFEKSRALINENEENPFAPTILLHTNVTNGYGIFSIRATRKYTILVP